MLRWSTPIGRLKSRTWARGQHTRYDYDDGGRLRYSRYFTQASADTGTNPGNDPNTPDVAITYDRLGRQTSQSNGLATSSFTYDPTTLQLDTETISYDFNLDNTPDLVRVLDRSQDSLGRSTGYQLKNGGTTESAATYNFSPTTARLDNVGNGTDTFTYAYTANSSLLESVTKSGSPVIQTTHTWEPTRNVLDVKENKVGSAVVSSYDYSVNDLGQRTAVDTAGSAFAAGERDRTWSYDALGQVTAESDANNAAYHRGFAYDAIGNRLASIEGNTDTTQAGATTYTPTALNQYDVIGVFSPTYDDDGNQLESQIRPLGSSSLESCVFIWDAENRLIEIKDAAATTTLASYTYDSQSRRIARTVGTTSIITLYDAWNPIAEYTGTPATGYTLQASYLWGLDLSGSMQGAGGVGGLLSVTSGAGSFYPTYDGNGNISEYLDATGVAVAHYEYDAFGNVIFSSGASAASFQHRFSTKPQDAESGLYYYGYRYLDPLTGRWPSRDPIAEDGGVNLYAFVNNRGGSQVDRLGLELVIIRVASSEESQPGTPQSQAMKKEISSWNDVFKDGSEKLDKFIAEINKISDEEWKSDNWAWSFNKGIMPDNHYKISGEEKAEIIRIAEGEKKSRIVEIGSGNIENVEAEVKKAAASLGDYGRIVIMMHGQGTMCYFPDGSDFEMGGGIKRIRDAAGGKPTFVIACGQALAFDAKIAGGLASHQVRYTESLTLAATIRFRVNGSSCKARLGSYRVQRDYGLPENVDPSAAPEGFQLRNPESFEY